jgi:hypothetical protein
MGQHRETQRDRCCSPLELRRGGVSEERQHERQAKNAALCRVAARFRDSKRKSGFDGFFHRGTNAERVGERAEQNPSGARVVLIAIALQWTQSTARLKLNSMRRALPFFVPSIAANSFSPVSL